MTWVCLFIRRWFSLCFPLCVRLHILSGVLLVPLYLETSVVITSSAPPHSLGSSVLLPSSRFFSPSSSKDVSGCPHERKKERPLSAGGVSSLLLFVCLSPVVGNACGDAAKPPWSSTLCKLSRTSAVHPSPPMLCNVICKKAFSSKTLK